LEQDLLTEDSLAAAVGQLGIVLMAAMAAMAAELLMCRAKMRLVVEVVVVEVIIFSKEVAVVEVWEFLEMEHPALAVLEAQMAHQGAFHLVFPHMAAVVLVLLAT